MGRRVAPLPCPRSRKIPLSMEHEILSRKTRVRVAAHNKNFVTLACTVLINLKGVTDTWTDTSTMAKPREALHMRSRV